MHIQVFGTGCAPCKLTLRNAQQAVRELGLADEVEHVNRIEDMIDAGITATPALAVDDEVLSMGKALSVPDIKAMLTARL